MAFVSHELVAIVREVWRTMLGEEIVQAAPGDGVSEPAVWGRVEITGGWSGFIELELSACDAERAASLLLGLDAGPVAAAERDDALGELTNVVAGNAKAALPPPARLGLPEHGSGRGLAAEPELRVAFAWGGRVFRVSVIAATAA